MNSKLIFAYAPMNSGKSMQLLAKSHNFDERNIPHLILKSSIDTRDGDSVIHSRPLGDKPCISVKPIENLYKIITSQIQEKGKIKYILVDEVQFMSEKQIDQLSDIVDYLNITVICYGLRTDFQTHLFKGSKRLFEIADEIYEIKSNCDCGDKNLYNARIDKDGNVVTKGSQIEVGGEDKYLTMCRKCYKEKTKKKI
jgi:thymidine kinase